MIFPEHMEFRYYITPERKECYELYSMTLGCRRTLLEKTQDLGQCLVDLYDTDFYDTYCVLSEINKLLRPLTPEHKDETAWRKLLELAMPLCKVHPFFGLLIKKLSDLEENHAYGKNDTKDILLRFDRDFENIVSDAKALIEVCLDDRYQPNYSTAERYREAHYDARLCFDDMRYGELATEEVMLERPAYDSAYNYSVEKLREQGIKTALREVLYPNTVRDLYNYLKGYCLRLPLPIHKCKNCGRYFVVTGNITQDYCTRLMEGSEKTCRQMGAVVQYQSRQMKNPATKEFTRSYKAHNARVRYGTMTKAEFTAWSKEARAKRADCIAGKLPLEEFVAWLDSDRQRSGKQRTDWPFYNFRGKRGTCEKQYQERKGQRHHPQALRRALGGPLYHRH